MDEQGIDYIQNDLRGLRQAFGRWQLQPNQDLPSNNIHDDANHNIFGGSFDYHPLRGFFNPNALWEPTAQNNNNHDAPSRLTAPAAPATATAVCIVCLDTLAPAAVVRIPRPCNHALCHPCLEEAYRQAAHAGTDSHQLCCSAGGPSLRAAFDLMRPHLSADTAAAFAAKRLEEDTPDKTYCHRRTCSAFIPPDAADGRCPSCQHLTCAGCKAAAHPGRPCPGAPAADAADADALRLAEQSGWRRCPNCRHFVERSGGCDHMTCRCRTQFCYSCGSRDWASCGCDSLYGDGWMMGQRRPWVDEGDLLEARRLLDERNGHEIQRIIALQHQQIRERRERQRQQERELWHEQQRQQQLFQQLLQRQQQQQPALHSRWGWFRRSSQEPSREQRRERNVEEEAERQEAGRSWREIVNECSPAPHAPHARLAHPVLSHAVPAPHYHPLRPYFPYYSQMLMGRERQRQDQHPQRLH
ncbi:putative E3 ubiquitin-protein ligase rbrA [Diplodia seriata]|uniref:RBR-type E3 ubiquitin transferase n=1 Tax=Diplodia seriata TaxID=420778 RepID=A0A1S8BKJ1_9PEZI|nr:putative E3 ubiquitin-protein ligase rbrA [Diplodia seriata]